jgi:gamma-glutamylcyclotransferase (GGCT)/AIG2-like uncharacterized protein YtfP
MTSPPSGPQDRLSAEPVDLFVYGSLLFPEVMRALLSRMPNMTPATLAGWRVAALPGRVYPALVRAEALAKGQLVTDLTPKEWQTLDAFEDPVYDLRRLTLTDGHDAWTYVCPDQNDVLPHDWDIHAFERYHLTDYLKRCAAWRQRHESQ